MPADLNTLCMSFLMFLNQLGTYGSLEQCPVIEVVPLPFLQGLACEGSDCPARAYYNRDEKIIYMLEGLDYENIMSRSILLHELVHYAQDTTDNWHPHDGDCRSAMRRELDAFYIQEMFLKSNHNYTPVSQQMKFYRC